MTNSLVRYVGTFITNCSPCVRRYKNQRWETCEGGRSFSIGMRIIINVLSQGQKTQIRIKTLMGEGGSINNTNVSKEKNRNNEFVAIKSAGGPKKNTRQHKQLDTNLQPLKEKFKCIFTESSGNYYKYITWQQST